MSNARKVLVGLPCEAHLSRGSINENTIKTQIIRRSLLRGTEQDLDGDLEGVAPDVDVGTGDEQHIGTADEVVELNEETVDNEAGQTNQNTNTDGGVINDEFWESFEDGINWGGKDFDHGDVDVLSSVKTDEKGDNVTVGVIVNEVGDTNKLSDHDDDHDEEREEVAEVLASLDVQWQRIDDTLAAYGQYFV